jgi:hypothetical protein
MTLMLAMLGGASIAHAEPSDPEKTLATTLFDDAKALLTDGKVPEACRKLEESRRLHPLPGTILNLAVCHEKEGLVASAFAEFREARLLAERDGRSDRVALADERMKAIEPRLSQLVVVVGADVDRSELRITRDATPLERAAWGTRIPVDPGEHIVEASAPGKKTRRIAVTVGREADVQTVVVGALDGDESSAPTVPAEVAPVRGTTQLDTPTAASTGLSTRRTFALASAGLGVVALGFGSYYGARAFSKHGDPAATCTTTPCSSASLSLNDQAKFAADAATVSFAVALVALVALGGAAFLWFGDTPPRSTAQVRLAPAFGPGHSGVDLSGNF